MVVPSLSYFPNQISPDELRLLTCEADSAGFDALWSQEGNWDSFIYDQFVATSAQRLRAGSSIARSYKRHPLLVAEAAAAIDRIAPGRFIIGLGTGPVKRADPAIKLQRWGTDANNPVERLEEYLDVIRLALSGDEVNFEGRFYAIERVRLEPTPNSEIPIYLAAGGPQLCRLAGRKADGLFVYFLNEARTRERVSLAREEAERAGRDPDELQVCALIPLCVDEDRERARSALRRHLFFPYLSLPYYQKLIASNGFPEAAEKIRSALACGGVDAAAKLVPEDALDAIAIGGEPGECAERLDQFVRRGIDVPILYALPTDDGWGATYRRVIEVFAVPRAA
jgi:alkanesulfonate monooxygenase SsuD/methylene tetrahydromethanopterin reductase-like flavin-dependent oxidoreductase (luciferase family)